MVAQPTVTGELILADGIATTSAGEFLIGFFLIYNQLDGAQG